MSGRHRTAPRVIRRRSAASSHRPVRVRPSSYSPVRRRHYRQNVVLSRRSRSRPTENELRYPVYDVVSGTMSFQTLSGPVSIIPATELRGSRATLTSGGDFRSQDHHLRASIPVNAAYYMRPLGVSTSSGGAPFPPQGMIPAYLVPPTQPQPRPIYSMPAHSSTSYQHPMYQGIMPASPVVQNGTHRSTTRYYEQRKGFYKSRGVQSYAPSLTQSYYRRSPSWRRHTYHGVWRLTLKLAQIACGAIVIGCVTGPTGNRVLSDFTTRTHSEGQIAVVVIAAVLLCVSFVFLVTLKFTHTFHAWKTADVICSGLSCLLYLIISSVEAWYAACYPPLGQRYPESCRLPEWAVATIFGYFAMFVYLLDFVFGLQEHASQSRC